MFVLIHYNIGHRSDVSANMTITEFSARQVIDGMYQIRVRNHKNFAHFGPAMDGANTLSVVKFVCGKATTTNNDLHVRTLWSVGMVIICSQEL